MSFAAIEERCGYTFKDKKNLENALTHSSYANECRNGCVSNERLAFLGDSILGMTVADYLYCRFAGWDEGKLSRQRADLVCETALAAVAERIDIGSAIMLGNGEKQRGGAERPSVLSDAFEALLAAVYIDGGLDEAQKFIYRHVIDPFEKGETVIDKDNKTRFQEAAQINGDCDIKYEIVKTEGPDHDKIFFVRVLLNGEEVGRGKGRSKKSAEQAAAGEGLENIKK